ncbi:MAG TPA: N-acetyltransferase [candidate division Zixibacteria bacterium]|nr:N-acetyltransferase [candidate division Zixibacteria bacterium]
MFEIKIMTRNDIDFATGLTKIEKWANSKTDFERLIKLNRYGSFVAHKDNMRVGIITTVIFGELAFVGNLIVSAKYRGRGIGRALMEQALMYLGEQKDIATIEIDGDFPVIELYRKLGFRDKYLSFRFCRKPADCSGGEIEAGIVDPVEINEIDKRLIDTPMITRAKFLAEFVNLHNGQIYVTGGNIVTAYSIIRKCSGDYYVLGPTMAGTAKDAELLIESIIGNYDSEVIYAGVPEINRTAVAIMLCNGFNYEQPSLRMYLGERIDYEKNIYTIISGDVG